jgi:type I restriction enzyme M protein
VVEALAPDAANPQARPSNVYVMRSQLLKSIEAALADNGLLTAFQVRGALCHLFRQPQGRLQIHRRQRLGAGADPG